jgi:hypothetical protein
MSVAGPQDECRAVRTSSQGSHRWVPAAVFVLFAGGFWATTAYLGRAAVADQFEEIAEFDLWVALFGALAGFAVVASVYSSVWLVGLVRLCSSVRPGMALWWVASPLLVLATVFAALFIPASKAASLVEKELSNQTRPIVLLLALFLAPGLVAFMTLRSVATEETNWQEPGPCQLRLILRLRAELRRLLGTFGAILTLLVITTGIRRRALLALDSQLHIPPEQVLLYGMLFAVLLGLFYSVASVGIDSRAQWFVDKFAPLPDPADPALSDHMRRRNDVTAMIGGGGSWRTFEATVVIAAPLLSALIGTAIAK